MDLLGCNEGWLVIFDRDDGLSWDEKIYFQTDIVEDKTIYIVGA